MMKVLALHHVQLAMPAGGETAARDFYAAALGLTEVAKPAALAKKGGVWFRSDGIEIHLGVEEDFRPARKAHPALLVANLAALLARCQALGYAVNPGDQIPGYHRAYVSDPFGNRVELLEPIAAVNAS
jgi:catechol 2,3-dioxygenase-like lactoylglutathione lyase family enzyme